MTTIITDAAPKHEDGHWIGTTPTGVKITGTLILYGDIMSIVKMDQFCGSMYYHVIDAHKIQD